MNRRFVQDETTVEIRVVETVVGTVVDTVSRDVSVDVRSSVVDSRLVTTDETVVLRWNDVSRQVSGGPPTSGENLKKKVEGGG